jgi:ParB family chromosome partitioning protein
VLSKRRGLGRGLEALIPLPEKKPLETAGKGEGYREIALDEITPARDQARKTFDENKLAELADSIKEHGVVQPVILRILPEGGYQLVAGERRLRACRKLGRKTIPAIIKDYKELEARAVSLIENVQRENLNPLEEAGAYSQLISDHNLTQEEVSERVGKSRSFVANMVRLLDLTEGVKEMLATGRISTGHARALLSIKDPIKQIGLAQKAERQQLSVRQIEKTVGNILSGQEAAGRGVEKPGQEKGEGKKHLHEIEVALKELLGGVRVKLKESGRGGGKLEINYNNPMELKKILEALLGKEIVSRETAEKR